MNAKFAQGLTIFLSYLKTCSKRIDFSSLFYYIVVRKLSPLRYISSEL